MDYEVAQYVYLPNLDIRIDPEPRPGFLDDCRPLDLRRLRVGPPLPGGIVF